MTRSSRLLFPALLLLVSCSKHPLHGGWREEGAKAPRVLSFDSEGSKLMVHTPPRPDGGHDHLHGTYALDGEKISVEWQEGGSARTYGGTVQGDRMELTSAAAEKLVFVRCASAH